MLNDMLSNEHEGISSIVVYLYMKTVYNLCLLCYTQCGCGWVCPLYIYICKSRVLKTSETFTKKC